MLAANRAVAAYLLHRGIESLHRVHEKPDARKVLEFEELARAFGYSLGVENLHQREVAVRRGRVPAPAKAGRPDSYGHGRERGMKIALPGGELRITPQHYQRLIKKVVGKPEERIVSYLMLRSLKQARYAAEPLGHFALGFDEYTHFTSPIRRYPDLIVHRILKWALENPNGAPPASQMHSAAPRGAEAVLYSHKTLEEFAGSRCVLRERDHAIVALASGGRRGPGSGRGARGSLRSGSGSSSVGPGLAPPVRAGGALPSRLVSNANSGASASGRGAKSR